MLCLLLLLAMLPACATRHVEQMPEVRNPWQSRAESLGRVGVQAMERGQWALAQRSFEQSLQVATLAGDGRLMALAWYNLGRARSAAGDRDAARQAFANAKEQAISFHDGIGQRRAELAMAMLDLGNDKASDQQVCASPVQVPDSYPVDIHLAVARLAADCAHTELARRAYARVIALAGADRTGLLYAVRAHLGLVDLDMRATGAENRKHAVAHLDLAFSLLRRAGDPHLLLRATRLAAELQDDAEMRQQWLQRAASLQKAIDDSRRE